MISFKKRNRWLFPLGMAGLILLGVGIAWGWFSGEPITRGRSVSSWLKEVQYVEWYQPQTDGVRDAVQLEPGVQAVVRLGRRAVPVLAEILTESPLPYRTNLFRESIRWAEWNFDTYPAITIEPQRKQSIRQTQAGIVLLLTSRMAVREIEKAAKVEK